MKIYHLSEKVISDIERRFTLIWITVICLSALLGSVPTLLPRLKDIDWNEIDIGAFILASLPTIISLLLILIFIWLVFYRAWKQQETILKSVVFELGEDYIAWRRIRVPDVRIRRDEISALQETGNALRVLTANKYRSISVPRSIDGFGDVKATLSSWAPTRPPPRYLVARTLIVAILTLLGMSIIIFSFNIWLVLIANVGLLGYFGYAYRFSMHQEGVDPRYRRNLLFLMGWILFFDLIKVCFLFGIPLLGK